MKTTYSLGWFRAEKRPLALLSVEAARQAHASGKPYTAIIGEVESPTCFIDFHLEKGDVGVSFLNSERRIFLEYQFRVIDGAQMFLDLVTERALDKIGRPVASFHRFFPDGRMITATSDNGGEKLVETEAVAKVDDNWEPVPGFGDYSSLARIERARIKMVQEN